MLNMIGIFDSGIGGLTVASAIRKRAPQADLMYFGDIANMPYGPKSKEELFRLTMRVLFFLRAQGASDYVAACNSVSVSVMQPLRDLFEVQNSHMIEMVGPASQALKQQTAGKLLVAATQATVRSGMYEQVFRRHGLDVEMIACPELASAIEYEKSIEEIQKIIQPVIGRAIDIRAQTLVFGCTQYPFARSIFEAEFQARQYPIKLFDPSNAVAQEAVAKCNISGKGLNTFFVSKQSSIFASTVVRLFGSNATVYFPPFGW
jgi:glutamate racemase